MWGPAKQQNAALPNVFRVCAFKFINSHRQRNEGLQKTPQDILLLPVVSTSSGSFKSQGWLTLLEMFRPHTGLPTGFVVFGFCSLPCLEYLPGSCFPQLFALTSGMGRLHQLWQPGIHGTSAAASSAVPPLGLAAFFPGCWGSTGESKLLPPSSSLHSPCPPCFLFYPFFLFFFCIWCPSHSAPSISKIAIYDWSGNVYYRECANGACAVQYRGSRHKGLLKEKELLFPFLLHFGWIC